MLYDTRNGLSESLQPSYMFCGSKNCHFKHLQASYKLCGNSTAYTCIVTDKTDSLILLQAVWYSKPTLRDSTGLLHALQQSKRTFRISTCLSKSCRRLGKFQTVRVDYRNPRKSPVEVWRICFEYRKACRRPGFQYRKSCSYSCYKLCGTQNQLSYMLCGSHNELLEALTKPTLHLQDSYTFCSSQNRPSEPLPASYMIYSTLNQPFEPLLKTHALNLYRPATCFAVNKTDFPNHCMGCTSFAVATMDS